MRLSVGPVLDLELGQLDRQVHDGDGDDLRFPLETQRGAQTATIIFGEKQINASKQTSKLYSPELGLGHCIGALMAHQISKHSIL